MIYVTVYESGLVLSKADPLTCANEGPPTHLPASGEVQSEAGAPDLELLPSSIPLYSHHLQ